MNLKLADRIVNEAIHWSWAWVVGNADTFGMMRDEMLAFWRRNEHMTPHNRYPYPAVRSSAGTLPAVEAPAPAVARAAR